MFVLYYSESDYDYHQMKILKVSKSKEKLENIKEYFKKTACHRRDMVNGWMDRQNAFYRQKCNEVADWFEQNMDAILEYPIDQKYANLNDRPNRFFMHFTIPYTTGKNYSDWRAPTFDPYQPDVIKKKKEFTEKIRKSLDYNPWSNEVYVDHNKVTTPFPAKERFEEKQPSFDDKTYDIGTLFIEEVEEV